MSLWQPESPAMPASPRTASVPRSAAVYARLALAIVGVAAVAIGLLHVLPASRVLDPVSNTLSEYVLMPDGWLFSFGVLVLALGVGATLLALVRAGLVAARSPATAAMLVACAGLIALVVFHKERLGVETSLESRVHWAATMVALASLPVATVLITWGHRIGCSRWARSALLAGVAAAALLMVIGAQTLVTGTLSIQVWPVIGLVERAVSAAEMLAVVFLARWAIGGCRCAGTACEALPTVTATQSGCDEAV